MGKKAEHRSMEQNIEARNKPIWSINLDQRRQEYTRGKDSLFRNWVWKSQKTCILKNGIKIFSHATYKN